MNKIDELYNDLDYYREKLENTTDNDYRRFLIDMIHDTKLDIQFYSAELMEG